MRERGKQDAVDQRALAPRRSRPSRMRGRRAEWSRRPCGDCARGRPLTSIFPGEALRRASRCASCPPDTGPSRCERRTRSCRASPRLRPVAGCPAPGAEVDHVIGGGMVSSSCSTTSTVLPRSRRRRSVAMRRARCLRAETDRRLRRARTSRPTAPLPSWLADGCAAASRRRASGQERSSG